MVPRPDGAATGPSGIFRTLPRLILGMRHFPQPASGQGLGRPYRRKPIKRVIARAGLIAAAVSFGTFLLILAIMGFLESAN